MRAFCKELLLPIAGRRQELRHLRLQLLRVQELRLELCPSLVQLPLHAMLLRLHAARVAMSLAVRQGTADVRGPSGSV